MKPHSRTDEPTAICLLSGGPDGAAAAALVRDRYALKALTVDYGQRVAEREVQCAGRLAKWLGVLEHRVVQLPLLSEVSPGAAWRHGASDRVSRRAPASEYVPFRNSVLLALAVSWAEAAGAMAVVIGSTGVGSTTPDNSSAYVSAFQRVVEIGTHSEPIEVIAPFMDLSKTDSIGAGAEAGVPFADTWSCQNNSDVPCAACVNCEARLEAFEQVGLRDPLDYPVISGQPG